MKITYDEYFARKQAPDKKEELENNIQIQSASRYKYRMISYSRYLDKKSKNELAQMSPESYRDLRIKQMRQLYYAYKSTSHNLMWIEPNETDEDAIRRVVGPKAEQVFNSGIIALDSNTVNAVNALAQFKEPDFISYGINNAPTSNLSAYQFERVVNELIACKEYAITELNDDISMLKLTQETDVLKRVLGKVQFNKDSFHEEGNNIFYIKDYELSMKDLTRRRKGLMGKTFWKIKSSVDKFLNPESKKYDPNRTGNKIIDTKDLDQEL